MKTCVNCGGYCRPSKAYLNELISFEDFGNDAGQKGATQSREGTAQLVDCLKCESCGHSFIPNVNYNFILVYELGSHVIFALLNKVQRIGILESKSRSPHFKLNSVVSIALENVLEVLPLNRLNLEYVEDTYPNIDNPSMIRAAYVYLTSKQDAAIRSMLKWYPSENVPNGFRVEVIKVLENFTKTELPEVISKEMEALNAFRKRYPSTTSADWQTFILGYRACQNLKQ